MTLDTANSTKFRILRGKR